MVRLFRTTTRRIELPLYDVERCTYYPAGCHRVASFSLRISRSEWRFGVTEGTSASYRIALDRRNGPFSGVQP
jgi:hypothetical protein